MNKLPQISYVEGSNIARINLTYLLRLFYYKSYDFTREEISIYVDHFIAPLSQKLLATKYLITSTWNITFGVPNKSRIKLC